MHIEHSAPLILASASPRRAELLRAAGIPFEVQPADVDETLRKEESATEYVQRVAEDKARVIAERSPARIVLAADTTVVLGDQILGKPVDADDARRMLEMLSGRIHQVVTGVTVMLQQHGRAHRETRVERTGVEFVRLTSDEIDWYVASGEPMDKAGAYGIQGGASRFVTRIDGSYSNVVGLPVAVVYQMLQPLMR